MIAAFEQQSCKHALKQGVLIVFGGVTEEEEGEGQGGEGQARRQGSICEGIADGGPDAASEGPQAGSGASSPSRLFLHVLRDQHFRPWGRSGAAATGVNGEGNPGHPITGPLVGDCGHLDTAEGEWASVEMMRGKGVRRWLHAMWADQGVNGHRLMLHGGACCDARERVRMPLDNGDGIEGIKLLGDLVAIDLSIIGASMIYDM